jgi:hypothetical protein
MYGRNLSYYGSNNNVKNYSLEQRKKDGRLRRYIPGRELGKIWDLSGLL